MLQVFSPTRKDEVVADATFKVRDLRTLHKVAALKLVLAERFCLTLESPPLSDFCLSEFDSS